MTDIIQEGQERGSANPGKRESANGTARLGAIPPGEIIAACARGNRDAEVFLGVFVRRAHFLDDLADEIWLEQKGDVAAKIAAHETEWLLQVAGNPFFQKHRDFLSIPMVLALGAWADSNAMNGPAADVLKAQYHEVAWAVAFLVGGYEHMRAMSSRYREFDFEPRVDSTLSPAVAPALSPLRGEGA